MMQKIDYINVTTDCWTSEAKDSYMSLTTHFINEDFERKDV